jgi:hypothetical protein
VQLPPSYNSLTLHLRELLQYNEIAISSELMIVMDRMIAQALFEARAAVEVEPTKGSRGYSRSSFGSSASSMSSSPSLSESEEAELSPPPLLILQPEVKQPAPAPNAASSIATASSVPTPADLAVTADSTTAVSVTTLPQTGASYCGAVARGVAVAPVLSVTKQLTPTRAQAPRLALIPEAVKREIEKSPAQFLVLTYTRRRA